MNYLTFWAERLARCKGFSFKEDKTKRWQVGNRINFSTFFFINKEQWGVER